MCTIIKKLNLSINKHKKWIYIILYKMNINLISQNLNWKIFYKCIKVKN